MMEWEKNVYNFCQLLLQWTLHSHLVGNERMEFSLYFHLYEDFHLMLIGYLFSKNFAWKLFFTETDGV